MTAESVLTVQVLSFTMWDHFSLLDCEQLGPPGKTK